MEQEFKGTFEKFNLKYDDSHAAKEKLFKTMLAWYVKMESFDGESNMQSDTPQIEAAPLLCDVAENIFKFEVEFEDE